MPVTVYSEIIIFIGTENASYCVECKEAGAKGRLKLFQIPNERFYFEKLT